MIDVSNLSDDEDLISKIQIISDKYIDLDAYGGFTFITDSFEYRQKKFFEIKFNTLKISKTQYFNESSIKLDLALLTINEDENEKAITITDEVSNKYHFEFDTVREAKMFNDAITASKKSISSKTIHYTADGSVSATLQALKDAFMRNGNDQCFECQAFGPEWSNPVIGITICVECSKYHRKMGLPMGLAKGLWLDKWKLHWIDSLNHIGNKNAKTIWIDTGATSNDSFSILKHKYSKPLNISIIDDKNELYNSMVKNVVENNYIGFYKIVFSNIAKLNELQESELIGELFGKCMTNSNLLFANLLLWLQFIPKKEFFDKDTTKSLMKKLNKDALDILLIAKKSSK